VFQFPENLTSLHRESVISIFHERIFRRIQGILSSDSWAKVYSKLHPLLASLSDSQIMFR
jgi:hypothetical protein